MKRDFNFKSVLNTDNYDRRRYTELRDISQRLKDTEEEGLKNLPTFPHLLGDVWSGLYKTNPQMAKEPNKQVAHHGPIMDQLLKNNEYQSMREHTKLDEFSAGIGTLKMGEAVQDIIKNLDEETKKQLEKAEQKLIEAKSKNQEAEMKKEGAELTTNEEQRQKLLDEANKLLSQAKRAEKAGQKLSQQAGEKIEEYLNSPTGQASLTKAISSAKQQTKEETEQVNNLFKGINAGDQPGEPQIVSASEKLKLAEAMKDNPKLQKVANLTGKAKEIAGAKQKQKSKNTPQRGSIEFGDAVERMLPQEMLVLKNQRQEFLRRYAEQNVLQYSKEGKEKLGKGPIIVLLDTSGSMSGREDEEAKAITLALLSLAAKQNRAFCLVNFSSSNEIKTWKFKNAKKVKAGEIVEIVEFFWNGGTSFMSPLDEAKSLIRSNKDFKKADIIMITDGSAQMDDHWATEYGKFKKNYQVNIISIQIGSITETLEKFSDKIINSRSLFTEEASNIFAI